MATSSTLTAAVQKLHINYLECSICHDTIRKPKALTCLHSFCRCCLQGYCDTKGTTTIACPVCRQCTVLPETGVNGLTSNFLITSLAGDIEELEAKLKCKSSNTACPNHREVVPEFYCETCHKLVCHKCLAENHRETDGHHLVVAGLVSAKHKQALRQHFTAYEEDIGKLEEDLTKITEAKQELANRGEASVKKVRSRAAELIAEVKAKEKELVVELHILGQAETSRLEEQESQIKEMLQPRLQLLTTAKGLVNNSEPSDLIFLFPILNKDLKIWRGHSFPRVADQLVHSVFRESQERASGIGLGEVVMVGSWKLCRTIERPGSDQGHFTAARGIMAAEPDEIAVADWFNGQVVIFDMQDTFKDSIAVRANDVAAVLDKWVLVLPEKVEVYNRDDKQLAFEFTTVPASKVGTTKVHLVSLEVLGNGKIIVGDKLRLVLTEHEPTNGGLVRVIPVNLAPYFLAVTCHGCLVISRDRCKDGVVELLRVDVCDRRTTVATIRPTVGNGKATSCRGACCDESGIYLAVSGGVAEGGHIHHYDCRGQYIRCLTTGLFDPHGITLTADGQKLAVADSHSVKIYQKV